MGSSYYRTLNVPYGVPLSELTNHFVLTEPFLNWECAFCSSAGSLCRCQRIDTSPGAVPMTRDQFSDFVLAEQLEAAKLQRASASYIGALERCVPLGQAFNADQRHKIALATQQLERLKERFADLLLAAQMLGREGDKVPREMIEACELARGLLANCFGNIRECHVCFKLNYMLCKGEFAVRFPWAWLSPVFCFALASSMPGP